MFRVSQEGESDKAAAKKVGWGEGLVEESSDSEASHVSHEPMELEAPKRGRGKRGPGKREIWNPKRRQPQKKRNGRNAVGEAPEK